MMLKGRYYMHQQAMDVCALIISNQGNGMFEVQWWNVGYVGNPWPIRLETDIIYMHPDVWKDITEYLQTPRESWN